MVNITGQTSTGMLKRIINGNMLPNFLVSVNDALTADDIFGPCLAGVKGISVRKPLEHLQTNIIPTTP